MGQVALSVAMFVLSTAAILARLHARRIRGGMLGWDDGCIYIAWVSYYGDPDLDLCHKLTFQREDLHHPTNRGHLDR